MTKKLLFQILKIFFPVSPDLLKYLPFWDIHLWDFGHVLHGFVSMAGKAADNLSTEKQKIKGFFLQFYVDLTLTRDASDDFQHLFSENLN